MPRLSHQSFSDVKKKNKLLLAVRVDTLIEKCSSNKGRKKNLERVRMKNMFMEGKASFARL